MYRGDIHVETELLRNLCMISVSPVSRPIILMQNKSFRIIRRNDINTEKEFIRIVLRNNLCNEYVKATM